MKPFAFCRGMDDERAAHGFCTETESLEVQVAAIRLTSDAPQELSAWTVIGSRHKGLVRHLAVLAKDMGSVVYGSAVSVYHMGPPLTSLEPDAVGNEDRPEDGAEEPPQAAVAPAHVAAWLRDLSAEDRQAMRSWHRRISVFFPAVTRPDRPDLREATETELARYFVECHYIAHPAFKVEEDRISRKKKFHRYSCVGFVTQCYESGPVEQVLTDTSRDDFPRVDKETMREAFLFGRLDLTPELAEAINLTGEGPWPIAMPGYVMRAFDRADHAIRTEPYHPSSEDIRFLGSE